MRWFAAVTVVLCWAVVSGAACVRRSTVPASMSDQEFWSLSEALSEPPGTFSVSDNLVSNEPHVAENIRRLHAAGGVYIGVGPEQNFSYIARLQPAMAFVIDIRRENRNLHLFYKALFALSMDRGDFVSRLFSRARPHGLGAAASAEEIFNRYERVPASPESYGRNLALIRDHLVKTRGLPLSPTDLEWIERVFKAFYTDGPAIRYWGSGEVKAVQPTYRQLMTIEDGTGEARSFLATEENFEFVKDMQARNLIVPVIGDFGGPGAIARVGDYVRTHGDAVAAFYGSNVAVYLTNRQQRTFCENLARLPVARRAWFIERDGVLPFKSKLKACGSGIGR
jgi:hypothetical protein